MGRGDGPARRRRGLSLHRERPDGVLRPSLRIARRDRAAARQHAERRRPEGRARTRCRRSGTGARGTDRPPQGPGGRRRTPCRRDTPCRRSRRAGAARSGTRPAGAAGRGRALLPSGLRWPDAVSVPGPDGDAAGADSDTDSDTDAAHRPGATGRQQRRQAAAVRAGARHPPAPIVPRPPHLHPPAYRIVCEPGYVYDGPEDLLPVE